MFLSVNGISSDAAIAITTGKQPTFFVMDGYDLLMALNDNVSLADFSEDVSGFWPKKAESLFPSLNASLDVWDPRLAPCTVPALSLARRLGRDEPRVARRSGVPLANRRSRFG